MHPRNRPDYDPSDEYDIEDLLGDAPDDLDDEEELVAWFADRLDIEDDELEEIVEDATETAGIVAALAFLKLFSVGWEALDDAQDETTAAQETHVGEELDDRVSEISVDMSEELEDSLDKDWGDEDGSSIDGLADINAQTEYGDSKHEADQDAGWEYAQYIAESDACDVCQDCHGTILPIDDPWWDDHEPDANHPNCRCIKVPLSAEEADARGGETKELPDAEVSGWKDKWPPDVSDSPPALQSVYHYQVQWGWASPSKYQYK